MVLSIIINKLCHQTIIIVNKINILMKKLTTTNLISRNNIGILFIGGSTVQANKPHPPPVALKTITHAHMRWSQGLK